MRCVVAPVPCVVHKIAVHHNEQVVKGQVLLEVAVFEMIQQIPAPVTGIIRLLLVKQGEQVAEGRLLAELDDSGCRI